MRSLRPRVCAEIPDASILLSRLRVSLGSTPASREAQPRFAQSRAAALRSDVLAEIEATSYLAVGRKYGVSDNAVRKWVRFYEREAERVRATT